MPPSRTWSLKSLTSTTSLRPSPSMSWIWNGVSAVSRPLRGSGRPSCQSTLPSKVTAVRQLIWMKLSPIRGMFWAMSISGTPSPSRSPNRTFRPAPNFGVANCFQSLGRGFSAAQLGELRLAPGDPLVDPRLHLVGCGDAEILEPRRDVGGDAGLAPDQLAVVGREDQLAVDEGPDLGPVVLDPQAVIARGVVRELGGAELAPVRHAEHLFERQAQGQAGLLAARQARTDSSAGWCGSGRRPRPCRRAKGAAPDLDRVIAPLGVAGQEDRVHQPGLVVDRVLLQVGLAVLLADGPGVEVADGVGPRPQRHAAVRQVVVFLDRGVELADRPREPAGGEPGEVVAEELGRAAGRAPRAQREELAQQTQGS